MNFFYFQKCSLLSLSSLSLSSFSPSLPSSSLLALQVSDVLSPGSPPRPSQTGPGVPSIPHSPLGSPDPALPTRDCHGLGTSLSVFSTGPGAPKGQPSSPLCPQRRSAQGRAQCKSSAFVEYMDFEIEAEPRWESLTPVVDPGSQ